MIDTAAAIDTLFAALRRQMNDAFPTSNVPDREQLGRDPMDPVVGRYLEEELDRRVEQELSRLSYDTSEWVSGESREFVDRALRNLRTTITASVSFPHARWESLLSEAVATACSFTMLPVSTLIAETFQLRSDVVAASTARSRVRALGGHPAITERVDAWLSSADEPIHRDSLRSVLDAIVAEVLDEEDGVTRVAEPLFSLHQRVNGKRVVPASRLVSLYQDVGREGIAERIEELSADSPSAPWNEGMLRHALSVPSDEPDAPEAAAHAEPAPAPATGAVQSRFEFDDFADEGVDEEPSESTADEPAPEDHAGAEPIEAAARAAVTLNERLSGGVEEKIDGSSDRKTRVPSTPESGDDGVEKSDDPAVPLWMRFQSKFNAPMSPRPPEPPAGAPGPTRAKGSPVGTTEKSTRPLWERYRKPESRADISVEAPVDFESVEEYVLGQVDAVQRQAYVETLFNGRASEYRDLVLTLSEVEAWRDATAIIADEVFRRNRVNIYSEIAISFTNAVEKRYKR